MLESQFPGDNIEITAAMIVEAFAAVNRDMDSFDEIVCSIYGAMESAKKSPPSFGQFVFSYLGS